MVPVDYLLSEKRIMFMFVCVSEFERNAFGLLEELYKKDSDKTEELVRRPLKSWKETKDSDKTGDLVQKPFRSRKETSIYQLAVDEDLKEFKTHDCLQAKLDKMWLGDLLAFKIRKVWQVGLHVLSLFINSKIYCSSIRCCELLDTRRPYVLLLPINRTFAVPNRASAAHKTVYHKFFRRPISRQSNR